MITYGSVPSIPWELLINLREGNDPRYMQLLPTLESLSPLIYCVWEDDFPIFAVGAYRPSLLSTDAEIWGLVGSGLGIQHLTDIRRFYREFLSLIPHPRLVARVLPNSRDVKFVKFFGGTYLQDLDDGTQLFEVNS